MAMCDRECEICQYRYNCKSSCTMDQIEKRATVKRKKYKVTYDYTIMKDGVRGGKEHLAVHNLGWKKAKNIEDDSENAFWRAEILQEDDT